MMDPLRPSAPYLSAPPSLTPRLGAPLDALPKVVVDSVSLAKTAAPSIDLVASTTGGATTALAGTFLGGGQGVVADLVARVNRLQSEGVKFQKRRRFLFWNLKGYKPADAQQVAKLLSKDKADRVIALKQGLDALPVDSRQDLEALDAFYGAHDLKGLADPQLGSALAALEGGGAKLQTSAGKTGAYGAWQSLTRNMKKWDALQIETPARKTALASRDDALVVAFLEGKTDSAALGKPALAEGLKALESQKLTVGAGSLETYRALLGAQPPTTLPVQSEVGTLADVTPARLEDPTLAPALQAEKSRIEAAIGALGTTHWQAMVEGTGTAEQRQLQKVVESLDEPSVKTLAAMIPQAPSVRPGDGWKPEPLQDGTPGWTLECQKGDPTFEISGISLEGLSDPVIAMQSGGNLGYGATLSLSADNKQWSGISRVDGSGELRPMRADLRGTRGAQDVSVRVSLQYPRDEAGRTLTMAGLRLEADDAQLGCKRSIPLDAAEAKQLREGLRRVLSDSGTKAGEKLQALVDRAKEMGTLETALRVTSAACESGNEAEGLARLREMGAILAGDGKVEATHLDQAVRLWPLVSDKVTDAAVAQTAARLARLVGAGEAPKHWPALRDANGSLSGKLALFEAAWKVGKAEKGPALFTELARTVETHVVDDGDRDNRLKVLAHLVRKAGTDAGRAVFTTLDALPAAERDAAVAHIDGMAGALGYDKATSLWAGLAPHRTEPDFADRVAALTRLVKQLDMKQGQRIWPSLERGPGTFTDRVAAFESARLLAAPDIEPKTLDRALAYYQRITPLVTDPTARASCDATGRTLRAAPMQAPWKVGPDEDGATAIIGPADRNSWRYSTSLPAVSLAGLKNPKLELRRQGGVGDTLNVSVRDAKERYYGQNVGSFRTGASTETIDLSRYGDQSVIIGLERDGVNDGTEVRLCGLTLLAEDANGKPVRIPLAGAENEQPAELLAQLAAEPDATRRRTGLETVARLTGTLRGPQNAARAWAVLAPHLGKADFDASVTLLEQLVQRGGLQPALDLWTHLDGLDLKARDAVVTQIETMAAALAPSLKDAVPATPGPAGDFAYSPSMRGAVRLWPLLATHRTDADLPARADAVATLASRIGVDAALSAWPRLETAPGSYAQRIDLLDAIAHKAGGYKSYEAKTWLPRCEAMATVLRPHPAGDDFDNAHHVLTSLVKGAGADPAMPVFATLDALRPAERTAALGAIQTVAAALSPEKACALWPTLVPHRTEADFDNRVTALTALVKSLDVKQGLRIWPSVERGPGTFTDRVNTFQSARLLAGTEVETKTLDRAVGFYQRIQPLVADAEARRRCDEVGRTLRPANVTAPWKVGPDADGASALIAPLDRNSWRYGTALPAVSLTGLKNPRLQLRRAGGASDTLNVSVRNASERYYGQNVCSVRGASSETIDLSGYADRSVVISLERDGANGGDDMVICGLTLLGEDASGKTVALPLVGAENDEPAELLARVGAETDPTRRRVSLDTLARLTETLRGPQNAARAWAVLAPHLGKADYDASVTLLEEMVQKGGLTPALELWAHLDGLSVAEREEVVQRLNAMASTLAPGMNDTVPTARPVAGKTADFVYSPSMRGAMQLWPLLSAHRTDADLAERADAVATLASRIGVDGALSAWPRLETAPGSYAQRIDLLDAQARKAGGYKSYDAKTWLARCETMANALKPHSSADLDNAHHVLTSLVSGAGADAALPVFATLDALKPAERTAALAHVDGVAKVLSYEKACALWSELVPHRTGADFGNRVQALTRLVKSLDVKQGLRIWPSLVSGPGTFTDRVATFETARLLAGTEVEPKTLDKALEFYGRITPLVTDAAARARCDEIGATLRPAALTAPWKVGTDTDGATALVAPCDRNSWRFSTALPPVSLAGLQNAKLLVRRGSGGVNDRLNVSVQDAKERYYGQNVASLNAPNTETACDLSGYGGRTIRISLERDGVNDPSDLCASGLAIVGQDASGAAVTIPLTGTENGEPADLLARVAGSPIATQRQASLDTLARLTKSLRGPQNAARAWDVLAPHIGEPDFDARVTLLETLVAKGGLRPALDLWPLLDPLDASARAHAAGVIEAMAGNIGEKDRDTAVKRAFSLWPRLAPHRTAPDFAERVEAVEAVARGGKDKAEAFWDAVVQSMGSDPPPTGPELAEAAAILDGVAGVVNSYPTAIEIWKTVAPSRHDPDFQDKTGALTGLTANLGWARAQQEWPRMQQGPGSHEERVVLLDVAQALAGTYAGKSSLEAAMPIYSRLLELQPEPEVREPLKACAQGIGPFGGDDNWRRKGSGYALTVDWYSKVVPTPLTSGRFSLEGLKGCRLTFEADARCGDGSSAALEVSDDGGVNWKTVQPLLPDREKRYKVDLSAYDGKHVQVRLKATPSSQGGVWLSAGGFQVSGTPEADAQRWFFLRSKFERDLSSMVVEPLVNDLTEVACEHGVPVEERVGNLAFLQTLPAQHISQIMSYIREHRDDAALQGASLSALLGKVATALVVTKDLERALARLLVADAKPEKAKIDRKDDGSLVIGGIKIAKRETDPPQ